MKRYVTKLCVLAIAGAIINVAVAWGCALLIDLHKLSRKPTVFYLHENESGFRSSVVYEYCSGAFRLINRATLDQVTLTTREADALDSVALDYLQRMGSGTERSFMIDARGWPIRNLYCEFDSKKQTGWFSDLPRGGITIGMERLGSLGRVALPLKPLWPEFFVNSCLYAAIVWMLFAVPGAARRRVRIKRGQCASCGYSLRGATSEQCPECGATA